VTSITARQIVGKKRKLILKQEERRYQVEGEEKKKRERGFLDAEFDTSGQGKKGAAKKASALALHLATCSVAEEEKGEERKKLTSEVTVLTLKGRGEGIGGLRAVGLWPAVGRGGKKKKKRGERRSFGWLFGKGKGKREGKITHVFGAAPALAVGERGKREGEKKRSRWCSVFPWEGKKKASVSRSAVAVYEREKKAGGFPWLSLGYRGENGMLALSSLTIEREEEKLIRVSLNFSGEGRLVRSPPPSRGREEKKKAEFCLIVQGTMPKGKRGGESCCSTKKKEKGKGPDRMPEQLRCLTRLEGKLRLELRKKKGKDCAF